MDNGDHRGEHAYPVDVDIPALGEYACLHIEVSYRLGAGFRLDLVLEAGLVHMSFEIEIVLNVAMEEKM